MSAGKGYTGGRPVNGDKYRSGYDLAFRRKKPAPTPALSRYKCRLCGLVTTREGTRARVRSFCDANGRHTYLTLVP